MNELTIAEDPKQFLKQMMSSFSERMWSAGWLSGLEFILWKKVRSCSDDLTLREIADFNFYAGLAGGWWIWEKDQKSEVFVTLDRWLEIYNQNVNSQ
ncbi:MAG: hypothetical protein RM049_07430 [Nostoc sp. DedQUE04]|uniref:hypothetical protein n=1 Tax=unclassified Nostoc TaxID=2593658 RepID=UPI002AD3FC31|nr:MULTISPECIES: hypothetical protein [unclassified Nostoc]MDZ8093721.1 hypothetical protein [Nostoc sp. DedQUE05]MDZ8135121.1 hypothetical protein [Nostoc sp. DedQUE04]